jgi:hypothetical protein
MLPYFTLESINVESQHYRIALRYGMVTDGFLVLIQEIVHFPEFSLSTSRFGCLSR